MPCPPTFGRALIAALFAVTTFAHATPTFKGTLTLDVNATDTRRRIVTVHERLPVQPGPLTLAYPQWEAASHAPSISAHRLAGLTISAAGKPLPWLRDPARVHLFRVQVPAGVTALDIDFQYLSPLGREASATLMDGFVGLTWQQLPVNARTTLPAGMAYATALPGLSRLSRRRHRPSRRTRRAIRTY